VFVGLAAKDGAHSTVKRALVKELVHASIPFPLRERTGMSPAHELWYRRVRHTAAVRILSLFIVMFG
jgi:hypothetical protein